LPSARAASLALALALTAATSTTRAQEVAPRAGARSTSTPAPTMMLRTRGELSLFPAIGYGPSLDHPGDDFVLLELGVGFVLHGMFRHEMGVVRGERFGRTFGNSLTAFLVGQADVAVPGSRRGHAGSFGLRLFESVLLGRHALALTASVGPRWDTTTSGAGVKGTAGVGYALVLPPWVVPLILELEWDYMPREGLSQGLRVFLAWPLG
jgi:hypothetical protein